MVYSLLTPIWVAVSIYLTLPLFISLLNAESPCGDDGINCPKTTCPICDERENSVECSQNGSLINGTLVCVVNTSTCGVEECEPNRGCLSTFSGYTLNLTNYVELSWDHLSFCSSPNDSGCDLMVYPQQISVVCHSTCFGNCSTNVDEDKFVLNIQFPPEPTTTQTTNSTEPTTGSNGTDRQVEDHFIVIGVIVAIIVFIPVVFLFVCLIYKLKHKVASLTLQSNSRDRRISFENPLSEQTWQLKGLIGQGRYGYVYKADYHGSVVALKIFTTHSRTAWENERNLYSMESTAHENIIEYVASEICGSGIALQRVLITRFYPLGSLNNYLRLRTMSWSQTCVMVRSIARGLAHLHSESYMNIGGVLAEKYAIAHRDIKSANILVKSDDCECVIGDLGFALILDPSIDAKQLANAGQAGTFRYMAPEALDATVNLNDLQSFKQIDVYAFALIMWEIMSRTCVLTEEDVPMYKLPYEEEAGLRPTLDRLKDIVVTRKLRPSLPAIWGNHEHLNSLLETLHECWDNDAEARLSAANVSFRMDELCDTNIEDIIQSSEHGSTVMATVPSTSTIGTTTIATIEIHRPTEHSQSSPPPYYSPTDPTPFHGQRGAFPFVAGPIFTQHRRPLFQTSMPHILSGDNEHLSRGSPHSVTRPGYHMTARCTRSLRSSVHLEQEVLRLNECNSSEAMSVRNSLLLCNDEPVNNQASESEEEFVRELSQSPRGQTHESMSRPSDEEEDTAEGYVGTIQSVRLDDSTSLDGRDLRPSLTFLQSDGSDVTSNLNSDSGILNSQSEVSHSNVTTSPSEGSQCEHRDSLDSDNEALTSSMDSGVPSSKEMTLLKDGSNSFPPPSENSENSVSTVTTQGH